SLGWLAGPPVARDSPSPSTGRGNRENPAPRPATAVSTMIKFVRAPSGQMRVRRGRVAWKTKRPARSCAGRCAESGEAVVYMASRNLGKYRAECSWNNVVMCASMEPYAQAARCALTEAETPEREIP